MLEALGDLSVEVEGTGWAGVVTLSTLDTGPSDLWSPTKHELESRIIPGRSFLYCKQIHSLRVYFLESQGNRLKVWSFRGEWDGTFFSIKRENIEPREFSFATVPRCLGEGDGIITRDPRFVPGVTVADCIPVYLFQKGPIYGSLHSGWQGTGIVKVALYGARELWGVKAEEFDIGFGPGICRSCYRVDSERASLVRSRFGDRWVQEVEGQGHWKNTPQFTLDLFGINYELVRNSGARLCGAEVRCTREQSKYWSYRRSPDSGRMFAFTLEKDST